MLLPSDGQALELLWNSNSQYKGCLRQIFLPSKVWEQHAKCFVATQHVLLILQRALLRGG